jgi:hypothetical protein
MRGHCPWDGLCHSTFLSFFVAAKATNYFEALAELGKKHGVKVTDMSRRGIRIVVGLCGLDVEGNVTFCNDTLLRMTGYRADEIIGSNFHELFRHSRPDGTKYSAEECAFQQADDGSRTCKPNSVCRCRQDGHSSGPRITAGLKRPTRRLWRTEPARLAGKAEALPKSPSLFGLAPCGVCPARRITATAVRSYRTFSPLPEPCGPGGMFSVALSVEPSRP